ncbi:Gfo/Idh/MocA family protein [Rhodobacteraceae bacterium DSL-40]|uniref:Gfo/Idh/MocA family protein n=1 Tax=Amaricoccus sp. B4 TaxID=3368557 RepID=UPI000DACD843
MAVSPIRWGILGAAKIAREFVCPALHKSSRGEVAAVASRDAARAAALAARYDARSFGSYDALLADPDIDAVYIPLHNAAHVEWTLKSLEAGKHVLCEKPIALRAEEIDSIIAARDRTGLFAAEGFMVTHHPQWRCVRELLAEGAIGRLRHVQGAFSFFNDDAENVRNQADLAGGALRDIGVYPCIVTRFVTGAEPESVTASVDWENGIDATARVAAVFPEFHMDFYISMRMAPRQLMTFHGETGWLSVHAPFNAEVYGPVIVELRSADGSTRRERFDRAEQYHLQADAVHAAILDGASYPCPLEFSRGNQRMIDMIYDAAG